MANQYSFDDLVDLIGPPVESWPRKILAFLKKSVSGPVVFGPVLPIAQTGPSTFNIPHFSGMEGRK